MARATAAAAAITSVISARARNSGSRGDAFLVPRLSRKDAQRPGFQGIFPAAVFPADIPADCL